jgi:BMFP domain-containing protein YqiC
MTADDVRALRQIVSDRGNEWTLPEDYDSAEAALDRLEARIGELEARIKTLERWHREASEMFITADDYAGELQQRVRELEAAIARWNEARGDCECREVHFLNLCETCASEEALADIARAALQREET